MKVLTGIVLTTALLAAMPALAGDIEAGKAKATVCAACHGAEGKSMNPLWPNLAGQQEQYLIKQLKDFKAGTRQDPLMSAQAAALSDADVENLAAYFASLK